MNDPFALLILFAAIVTIWVVFILAVVTFFRGAARGREEYESRLPRHTESPDSYSYRS